MALRHEFPLCSLSSVNRDTEEMRIVRATRRPVTVGFRSGGDITEVVDAMRTSRYVSLNAACGAGKSVKVPILLATATQKLVVHTIPSRLASLEVAQYVATTTSVSVVYYGDIDTDVPTRGVVLMSNAMLAAVLLSKPDSFKEPFVLFMDESHESDAFTDVLRTLGPNMDCVSNFITATATGDVDGFRKKETPGLTTMSTFHDVNVDEWEVYDEGKPWSVNSLVGNSIIFVERRAYVTKLQESYMNAGYDVYILHSRMDEEVYRRAIQAFRSGDNGIVVLLADYSFRSSFTYKELEHVIDIGEVCVNDVNDEGRHVKVFRDAYKLEMEQAAGRGARVPGSSTTIAQAVKPYKSAQAVLEGVEMDAAALLFRMFGYKPPRHLQHLPIASGKVPKDLVEALRSPIPLRCILESSLVEWVGNESVVPPLPVMMKPGGTKHRLMPISRAPRFPPREKSPPPSFNKNEATLEIPVDVLDLPKSRPVSVGAGSGSSDYEDAVPQLRKTRSRVWSEVSAPSSVSTVDIGVAGVGNDESKYARVTADDCSLPPDVPVQLKAKMRSFTAESLEAMRERNSAQSIKFPDLDDEGGPGGDAAAGDSHDEFVEAFTKLMSAGVDAEVLEIGNSYYYHPVADGAMERCAEFPNGVKSVVQFLERDKSGAMVRASRQPMRAYMMSVLLDAYNESVAETRAILRLGSGLSEFGKVNAQASDPNALRLWVSGLAETLHTRGVQCKVYAGYMLQVAQHGYRVLSPMAELEARLLQGHAMDLQAMAGQADEHAGESYHRAMSARAVNRTLSGTVADRLIEAEPGSRGVPMSDRKRHKAITAGQVRVRDMKGPSASGTSVEVGRVGYEIQPSSGLGSIWARPLMKLIGQGEMKVVLK